MTDAIIFPPEAHGNMLSSSPTPMENRSARYINAFQESEENGHIPD